MMLIFHACCVMIIRYWFDLGRQCIRLAIFCVLCSVFCVCCDLWVTDVCKFDLGRQCVSVGGVLCSVCCDLWVIAVC